MSFNRSLWKATGALIGTEARALMNQGAAGSDFWAPGSLTQSSTSPPQPCSDLTCSTLSPLLSARVDRTNAGWLFAQ